ncbi:MAG: HAMP domain-containing protein, partial [Calditrichota bacterium]
MKPTLQSKLFIIVLLSILFGITSVGTALYFQFSRYLNDQVENVMEQYLLLSETALDKQKLIDLDMQYLKFFAGEQSKVTNCRFTIIDKNGRVLADSEVPFNKLGTLENHLERPEVQLSQKEAFGTDRRLSSTINRQLLYMSKQLTDAGTPIGFIRIAVFAESTDRLLATIRRYSVYGGLIILIISGLLLALLSRRISKNLKSVMQHAENIAGGDFESKLRVDSKDELGSLASALNEMSTRLSTNISKLSREREDLNMVLSSVKEGIMAIDEEGNIILFNDICLEMLKRKKRKNVQDKHFTKVIKNPHLIGLIENFLKHTSLISDELFIEDGSVIEIVISPFSLHQRQRLGAVVVLRDITQFKTLEKIRRDFV